MEKAYYHEQIVKRHIDALDYYGLLAGGAPRDEFAGESRQIAERITSDMTAEQIEAIIADVLYSAFAPDAPIVDLLPTAQRIKDEL